VFWTTMFGNFAEKSSAFCATKIATLRAMALYDLPRRAVGIRDHRSAGPNRPARGMRCRAAARPGTARCSRGTSLRAALAEDVLGVAALRADVDRHVLDDAHDRHADLLEHLEALARVDQRDVLRRRHDDGAGDRHLLRERELDVAGAGRHVDDQVVELAPVGVLQQLLERLRDHRAAPHHRRVGVDQEADRHRLHAVRLERLERLPVLRLRTPGQSQHHRLRRP
jgi:hypothetical protein